MNTYVLRQAVVVIMLQIILKKFVHEFEVRLPTVHPVLN
jgi:hypothetical protein